MPTAITMVPCAFDVVLFARSFYISSSLTFKNLVEVTRPC